MRSFSRCILLVLAAALVEAALLLAPPARADEPGVVVLQTQVVVGNPRRPIVTIELARARPNIPLHALTHPLDKHDAPAAPSP
jgi:hypothetical protein